MRTALLLSLLPALLFASPRLAFASESALSRAATPDALVFKPFPALPAADQTEYWIGQILVPNPGCAQITFVVTLTQKNDAWSGRLSLSPGCGVGGMFDIPLEELTRTNESLKFVTPAPPQRNVYDLTLTPDGASGTGRILIGGMQPLYIRAARATEAEAKNAAPKRPQMPVEPLPYERREITVKVAGPSGSLAGILNVPKQADGTSPSLLPAVLLLSDEDPVDVDHSEGTHKPGLVLADLLARRGIIVLRCASPGMNGSEGTYLASSMQDAAADANGAVAFLRSIPGVDPARVALVGRGEGAFIAARAAAGMPDLPGVVLMAPAAVSWRELLLLRERAQLQTQGEDASYLAARLERFGRILDAAAKNDAAALEVALREDFEAQTTAGRAMGMLNMFQQRDALQVQADFYLTPRIVSRLNEDPRPFLEQLRLPVLLLAGERDLLTPTAATLPPVQAALKTAGNQRVTATTFPSTNHWFQPCNTGFPEERDQIETTIDPKVADAIADWVTSLGKR